MVEELIKGVKKDYKKILVEKPVETESDKRKRLVEKFQQELDEALNLLGRNPRHRRKATAKISQVIKDLDKLK